jgi:hypothetical protein
MRPSLQLQLVELIAAGHFALPPTVVFAGFDRLHATRTAS